jgi:hypothetical protein
MGNLFACFVTMCKRLCIVRVLTMETNEARVRSQSLVEAVFRLSLRTQ